MALSMPDAKHSHALKANHKRWRSDLALESERKVTVRATLTSIAARDLGGYWLSQQSSLC
jgi:hypothetical protein